MNWMGKGKKRSRRSCHLVLSWKPIASVLRGRLDPTRVAYINKDCWDVLASLQASLYMSKSKARMFSCVSRRLQRRLIEKDTKHVQKLTEILSERCVIQLCHRIGTIDKSLHFHVVRLERISSSCLHENDTTIGSLDLCDSTFVSFVFSNELDLLPHEPWHILVVDARRRIRAIHPFLFSFLYRFFELSVTSLPSGRRRRLRKSTASVSRARAFNLTFCHPPPSPSPLRGFDGRTSSVPIRTSRSSAPRSRRMVRETASSRRGWTRSIWETAWRTLSSARTVQSCTRRRRTWIDPSIGLRSCRTRYHRIRLPTQ